jgi:hypothetical protein
MQACSSCGAAIAEPGPFCPSCGAARATTDRVTGAPDAGGSLVGRTVGDFAIEGVIGGGSFGTVYRGRQLGLDRPVAIKVPTYDIAGDPVQAQRFAREARAAARIVHPGVVAIYAVGELGDGRPYLAMQRIDGAPLDRVLDDGPIPALRALGIARAIASALSETHAADVVHRDLKPANIMWRRDRNGDDRITLVDFGIAVCKPGSADATRLTTTGLIGTPHYMSPEQAQGEPVDGRADLYALGCVMFELVTGAPPFQGSGFEVLVEHLGRPAPRASERNPEVPELVDRLIAELLEKRPADRPASADAVVGMIDRAIAAISAAGRAGAGSPVPRRRLRRGTALAALAGLALSGAGFAAFQLRSADGERTERDEREPAQTATGPVSALGEPLRLIVRDDGELIVRTLIPQVIHARTSVAAHLEITTKLGGRFSAKQVVITIEDPHHEATAQSAVRHGDQPGHYAFHHAFAEPGVYVVRIFPSETETMSTIELEVVP